jgi:hypothetical protein
VIVDAELDAASLGLLEDGLRKTMLSASGVELDAALDDMGWADMLSDMAEAAIPLVFRLLGETGSHASILNDVVLQSSRREPGGTPALRGRRSSRLGTARRHEFGTRRVAAAPGRGGRTAPIGRGSPSPWLVACR